MIARLCALIAKWRRRRESWQLERIIQHNERVRREDDGSGKFGGAFPSERTYRRLLPHPTIECRWILKPGERPINFHHEWHGRRMAVAWRHMGMPECTPCMQEDPYE